jgi:hypothetical protein
MTADEPKEGRVLAVGFALLVDEREVLSIELLEPFVPRNVLQLVCVCTAREVDSEYSGSVVPCPVDGRRSAAVFLDPTSDLIVINGLFGIAGHLYMDLDLWMGATRQQSGGERRPGWHLKFRPQA